MDGMRRRLVPAMIATIIVACSSYRGATDESDAGAPEGGAQHDGGSGDDSAVPVDASDGAAPTMTTLATGIGGAVSVAANDTTVFVAENDSGRISSIPIAGGTFSKIIQAQAPVGLVVVGSTLFWADAVGKIGTSPLDGSLVSFVYDNSSSAPTTLTSVPEGLVFFTKDERMTWIQPDGGPLMTYLVGSIPFAAAARNDHVMWTQPGANVVWDGTRANAQMMALSSEENDCQSIAANANGTYWSRPSDSLVRGRDQGGVHDMATGQTGALSLTADDSGLYWLTSDGAVRRLKKPGDSVETLASGPPPNQDVIRLRPLAVSSQYVVWVAGGTLYRVAK